MSKGMGVDVGGSAIKGAVVDLEAGQLITPRTKHGTPQPATPEAVIDVVVRVVRTCEWQGPVGCGLPGVIRSGQVDTAPHLDQSWVGVDAVEMLTEALGMPVVTLNDAAAAGIAEMRYGAGKGRKGTVLLLTLGTGIGSALFVDGTLIPNTELGHVEMWGATAEERASATARKEAGLSWAEWAKLLTEYFDRLGDLLGLDLIIIGGGVSRSHQKFLPLVRTGIEVVPAKLRNNAGIIGAALVSNSQTA
jgi:polyphosphate glucokinase